MGDAVGTRGRRRGRRFVAAVVLALAAAAAAAALLRTPPHAAGSAERPEQRAEDSGGVDWGDYHTYTRWLWWVLIAYMFMAQAEVCDEYFVQAISVMVEKFRIPENVAGATVMALGCNGPELVVNTIGLFIITDAGDVGTGTIVGSEIFNLLAICGGVAIVTQGGHSPDTGVDEEPEPLTMTMKPFLRDIFFYFLSIVLLAWSLFSNDGHVTPLNALVLLGVGIVYVLCVVFGEDSADDGAEDGYGAMSGIEGDQVLDELERRGKGASMILGRQPSNIDHQMARLGSGTDGHHGPGLVPIHDRHGDSPSHISGAGRMAKSGLNDSGLGQRVTEEEEDHVWIKMKVRQVHHNRLQDREGPKQETVAVAVKDDGKLVMSTPWRPKNAYEVKGRNVDHLQLEQHQILAWRITEKQVIIDLDDGLGGVESLVTDRAMKDGQVVDGPAVALVDTIEEVVPHADSPRGNKSFAGTSGAGRRASSYADRAGMIANSSVVENLTMVGDAELPKGVSCSVRCVHALAMPINFVYSLSMGWCDPKDPEKAWAWPFCFMISMGWLSVASYAVVYASTQIHDDFGIPYSILGVTVCAVGTSFPNFWASIAMAKKGRGVMAIANALGSNIQNIFLALAIPWVFKVCLPGDKAKGLAVNTNGFGDDLTWMMGTLFLLMLVIIPFGCKRKTLAGDRTMVISAEAGWVCVLMYFFYLAYTLYHSIMGGT